MKKQFISIVAPMYNEEECATEYCKVTLDVLESVKADYDYELILVNDGSKDNTLSVLNTLQSQNPEYITIVNLTRNFGLEGAVHAGLQKAVGDAVIVMDADLQDPPQIILSLIKKWDEGFDVVNAMRVSRNADSFFKQKTAKLYYNILNSLSGKTKLQKDVANFRLLSRNALNCLLALPESNSVFRISVPVIGMRTATVEYHRDVRNAGETKYNLKNMIPYALDSITGLTVTPLRKIFWSIPICAFVLIISLIGIIFTKGTTQSAFIVCIFVSFLFIVLFACLSILAEYIAQIMIESKHRPISSIYEYLPCENAKRRTKQ